MAEPEKLLKKCGIALLCILLVVYFCKQISTMITASIEVETALAVTVEDKTATDGYILRNETILYAPSGGIMLPSVTEGARLSKGQEVVRVFSRENDVSIESSIRAIDAGIRVLERSAIDTDYATADLVKTDEEIRDLFCETAVFVADNDLVGAMRKHDEILEKMNKRWLIANPDKSFTSKLSELMTEKVALKSRLSGTSQVIYSPTAGYYSSELDGYEQTFSAEKLPTLTLSQFKQMTSEEPASYSGATAGKVVTDYVWYLACPIPAREAMTYNTGDTYTLEFPYAYGMTIPMTLSYRIAEDNAEDAVLVFSTGRMPDGFEYTRKQKVNIISRSYSGLKIPKNAIRFLDEHKGVYVMKGNVVEFKILLELYTADDYCIVDMDATHYPLIPKGTEEYAEKDENGETVVKERTVYYEPLSLYDQVILNGKEIYDGMRVD